MNVVIYARYSSHSQTEQSIEGQLKECYEYAKRNGFYVVGEYIDRAVSATTDKRPEFLRMIEDSRRKSFSLVLVYQLDRFARNRFDSATYKAKLKKNDVRVVSVRENIADDASGILVEGVLESMAEYYSAELSQKIRRGKDLNGQKCLATGGNVALGYRIEPDKTFGIDERGASIVVKIFELYASGKTVKEITDYLNMLNYRTSRNVAFNKNSLYTILRNKRYIGIYTYKGNETPNGIPRIVSDDLFNKVQEILGKNKEAPARSRGKEEFLLTTKLFCGHCKKMMTGYSGTSKTSKKHYYYVCNGRKKKTCIKKNVRKELIEDVVINQCYGLLTDVNIDKITSEVVKLSNQEFDNSNVRRLQKIITENKKAIENLMIALESGQLVEMIVGRIEAKQKEIAELESQIVIEQAGRVALTHEEVKNFLLELRKGNVEDIKYRRILVNIFVSVIYLYDDKLTIVFNVGDRKVNINTGLIEEIEEENQKQESSSLVANAPLYIFRNHMISNTTQILSNRDLGWFFSFIRF